jgi:N-acetylmuramoyl-L-alanine amidase
MPGARAGVLAPAFRRGNPQRLAAKTGRKDWPQRTGRKGLDRAGGFAAQDATMWGLALCLVLAAPGDAPGGHLYRRDPAVPRSHSPPPAHRAAPPRSRYNITIPLDPPGQGPPRPRVTGPAGRPLVVIDPGHGGHDPGASAPGGRLREKDVTLSVARKIRDALIASGRVRVALTRDDDRFLVLHERSQAARAVGADLFISIHADSAGNGDATGATVYTLSEVASDREAAALAARENKADVINGVDLGRQNAQVSSILIDLAQRETMGASSDFADILKREAAGLIPFRDGFHRMAGFIVLKAPDTPAVLLEIGYLTNPADAARLASREGQARIAEGVRKAVEIHFARRSARR